MPRLHDSVRAAFRHFAFRLTNETLGLTRVWPDVDACAYTHTFLESPGTYGPAWSIFVANLWADEHGRLTLYPDDAYDRAAQLLRARVDPTYEVAPPFEAAELDASLPRATVPAGARQLHVGVRTATQTLAAALGEGRLGVLTGAEPGKLLTDGSSVMESLWSVFANVLELDADGRPIDPQRAIDRASQWWGELAGGPPAVPRLESWELELPVMPEPVER
ncbi:MAG: hypothetical protein M3680_19735 [Myxococcota bacterium]|nr:hypothetical protein [Myxococcota bacterium]